MSNLTPTELRKNIYQILDEVLATGIPVEIIRKGKTLKIIAIESSDKLQNLCSRPEVIAGNPDDLPDIHWDDEIKLDTPL
ncbi:MAG: type II toxin-antitoxin system Phd/YefM family antitoxin [Proteobacteria bacterium]|nr:type II toxin-antitoxin system Phd/YefM family antitoxin [Pseudomonadota bacterium]